jgi:two-component system, OmpR family, sensor kinase
MVPRRETPTRLAHAQPVQLLSRPSRRPQETALHRQDPPRPAAAELRPPAPEPEPRREAMTTAALGRRSPGEGMKTPAVATTAARTAELSAPTLEPHPKTANLRRRILVGRWPRYSLRTRILVWYVGLLAFAALSATFVAREVLLTQVDQRIDDQLVQETAELRRLANGNDPATGGPFDSRVRAIFRVLLERNVASRNEVMLTFVDGRPFLRSARVTPYRLDRDPGLVALWGNLRQPDRGRVDTPQGRVEYLAVPLRSEGPRGVFVVAIFRDLEKAREEEAFHAVAIVALAVLLIGSLLALRLAGKVLEPVRSVTRTARQISDSDLSQRMPVRGRDELAELTVTLNGMFERLERAFATQRRFIDDAGHELKTPITIVRGHLELLEEDPAERQQSLSLVMDELDRMGRMVDDLLLLARRRQPDFLDLEGVDVEELTGELRAKASTLGFRDWSVERTGRGIIAADRQRLTQAVIQLAHNAAAHTEDGDAIMLGSSIEDGEARFSVSDTGPGIPAAERKHIFDRFARGRDGRRNGGAGLGLAIVKAIAEAHGGRVEVESRVGYGSTFTIVIPTERAQ